MANIIPRIKTDANEHPNFRVACLKIENLLEKNRKNSSTFAIQGSAEWIKMRNFAKVDAAQIQKSGLGEQYFIDVDGATAAITIGGSEIAAVIGLEAKYRTMDQIIYGKVQRLLGIEEELDLESLHNTVWGHLFEPVIKSRTEQRLGTTIYEVDGSLNHKRVINFRYSPDGIGPVALRTLRDSYLRPGHPLRNIDEEILVNALYEFKCPFSRVVKNKIPEHYTPQVLSGTSVLDDLVGCGIFSEANYKIKPIGRLFDVYYNASVHMMGSLNGKTKNERYDGLKLLDHVIIFFYTEQADYVDSADGDTFDENDYSDDLLSFILLNKARHQYKMKGVKYPICDFGGLDFENFKKFMHLVHVKQLIPYYTDIYSKYEAEDRDYDPHQIIIDFIGWCKQNGKYPYGMLPASQYTENICYLPSMPFYVDLYKPLLNEFTRKATELYNQLK